MRAPAGGIARFGPLRERTRPIVIEELRGPPPMPGPGAVRLDQNTTPTAKPTTSASRIDASPEGRRTTWTSGSSQSHGVTVNR